MPNNTLVRNKSWIANMKDLRLKSQHVLQDTLKSGQNRRCRDVFGVILFFAELITLICLYVFTDFPRVSYLESKIGLIGVTTDVMGRVCGVEVYPDFRSPRLPLEHVSDMCRLLGYYNCDYDVLHEKLSHTGKYSVSSLNDSVCVAEMVDCRIEIGYSYIVDDVYYPMMNALRGVPFNYQNRWFITKAEFVADYQLLEHTGDQWILYFAHYLPTLTQDDTTIYERYFSVDSLGYKMCQHSYGDSVFSQISNMPKYLLYFSSYFTNFRSLFIYELISYAKYIMYGILSSFALAYVFCLIITMMSKAVIYVAWLLVPLALIGFTVLLVFLFAQQSDSQELQLQMFNFTDYGKNLLVVVLIIAAVLLCGGAVFFFIFIIFQREDINRTSQCIRICASILKNRLRLYFMPIMFMAVLLAHTLGCGFLILCALVSGNFDSTVNMYTLVEVGADGSEHLSGLKVCTISLTAVYLVQGLFLISYIYEYIYGILTTSWYTDRISLNYEVIKYLEIDFTSPRALREVEKMTAKGKECNQIDVDKFSKHQGKSYLKAAKHMFYNFGSLFEHATLAIVFFVPKLILRFLNWLKQDSQYAFVMQANISPFFAKIAELIDRGLAITDRQVIFYLQISGLGLGQALRFRRCFEVFNVNVIADIKRATLSVYSIGKFISVAGGIVLEQIFEMLSDYSTFVQNPMRVTTVLVCLIFTIINNSFVLHLIDTLNISLIYNYNMDLGIDSAGRKVNYNNLPPGILKFFEYYNLTKLQAKFQIKLIQKCFE